MKNSIYALFALMAAIFIISACNKYGELSGLKGTIAVSKKIVKINEPDSMLLVGAKATDTVQWSVSPAGFDSLVTKHNKALIIFKKAGNYTVTATDHGTPATVSIKVIDSVYHQGGGGYTTIPLTGDTITLVPHYYKSPTSDSSYIQFVARTKKYYCGTSILNLTDSLVNNSYQIAFLSVSQTSLCNIGETPIARVINFTHGGGALPTGTFPLGVSLNGINYTGSIVVTATNITFNWSYSGAVIISPKQVSR